MTENHDDLTAAERNAFSELAREISPPPAVEERIVAALKRRGLIRSGLPGVRAARWLGAVAASVAIAGAGYLLGRASTRPPAPPEPRYALFLLRGAEEGTLPPREEATRVEEYRSWAKGLAGDGRYVTGEKLEDRAGRLGAPDSSAAPPQEELRGFFVISASDFDDALAVARGCPHLRHGGKILVRPIAPV